MANIKSSKKRIKVTARRKEENRGKKTELATAIKKFRALVTRRELEEAGAFLPHVFSLIDSGSVKGRLHKNNASRKKARLALMLSKAQKLEQTQASTPQVEEVKVAPVEEVEKVEEIKIAEPVKAKPAPKKATTNKTATAKTATAKTATAKTATAKTATAKTATAKTAAKTTTKAKTSVKEVEDK